jgi:hypothetical protein
MVGVRTPTPPLVYEFIITLSFCRSIKTTFLLYSNFKLIIVKKNQTDHTIIKKNDEDKLKGH